jgi:hypothetical protein
VCEVTTKTSPKKRSFLAPKNKKVKKRKFIFE